MLATGGHGDMADPGTIVVAAQLALTVGELDANRQAARAAAAGAPVAAASANGVFIAVADRCGNERGVDWIGGSVTLRPWRLPGRAGWARGNRPAVLTASIDLRLARGKRIGERNDLFADRRPDLYARLWDLA